MAKRKKSTTKHISHTQTHILLRKSLAVYSLLVFIGFVLISLSAYALSNTYTTYTNNKRLTRINTIYSSLKLGSGYYISAQDVFGDKRVEAGDDSRSEASSINGGHNDTPANTLRDLTAKVEAAGFSPAGNVTDDLTHQQTTFKDSKGEWIRLNVVSATIYDRVMYNMSSKGTPITSAEEQAAPTYFTVWVNLDDNNT